MRILLACPYAWDAPGGVQVQVRQLAGRLLGRGHEVLVLAPGHGAAPESWVRIVGRPVRVGYQGTVAPICFSPASWVRVGRALDGFRPDVVHANEPTAPSTAMFATLRAKVPVVATFHAHVERSLLLSTAAPVLRLVWGRLRVRMAVSEAARTFYASRFGEDIRIVPNGCEVELFAAATPSPDLPPGRRVLWVGRLEPKNGFPFALEAFRLLADRYPDLRFVVVGDGRDRDMVAHLPAELRPRVVMKGNLPHDRLPPLYAGADVFVAPAIGQHSFGVVLVEAMAAGIPVVASDIPGYREVVRKDVDGLLVRPGHPEALAAALGRILDQPPLASHLAEAGRDRARAFRWEAVLDQVETAYRDALRGAR